MTFVLKTHKPRPKPDPSRISERYYNSDAERFLRIVKSRKSSDLDVKTDRALDELFAKAYEQVADRQLVEIEQSGEIKQLFEHACDKPEKAPS